VGGVATQGRAGGGYWTTSYSLSYSEDGVNFKDILDDGNTISGNKALFRGNENHYEVVRHDFVETVEARYIRLTIQNWGPNGWPCIRWDVFRPQNPWLRLGRPLGVSDPAVIANSRLSASSAHGNNWEYYGPSNARLHRHINWGGWIPNSPRAGEWVQVDLGEIKEIGGISTQGSAAGSHWLTQYTLVFSRDGTNFHSYMRRGQPLVFSGNNDPHTAVNHVFSYPFQARFVRIYAQAFSSWPALRWELYAPSQARLNAGKAFIGAPLGLESGEIKDSAISASSSYAESTSPAYLPKNARLNSASGAGCWAARTNDLDQWLQIRIPDGVPVGGIALQARNLKSEVAQGWAQWITSYRVAFSDDAVNWKVVQRLGSDRYFRGPMGSNDVALESIAGADGIRAKYIRILPDTWFGHISARVEVYNTAKYENDVVQKELRERKEKEAKARAEAEAAEKALAEKRAAEKKKLDEEAAAIAKAEEEQRVAEETTRRAATAAAKEAAQKAQDELDRKVKALKAARDAHAAKVKADEERLKAEADKVAAHEKAIEVRLQSARFQRARVERLKQKTVTLKAFLENIVNDARLAKEKVNEIVAAQKPIDEAVNVFTQWLVKRGDDAAASEVAEMKAAEQREKEEKEKAAQASASGSGSGSSAPPAEDKECTCAKKLGHKSDSADGLKLGPDAWPKPEKKPGEEPADLSIPTKTKPADQ
jgi:hypothetical protein